MAFSAEFQANRFPETFLKQNVVNSFVFGNNVLKYRRSTLHRYQTRSLTFFIADSFFLSHAGARMLQLSGGDDNRMTV